MSYSGKGVCDCVVVSEAATSSLLWAPSHRRRSTVVRARPANPTHSSWPSVVVTLPSRLILRVSTAASPTSAVSLVPVPGARACGCRYSLAHVVHVYCCVWSVCGWWRGRLRPCRVHPEHSVHTFSSAVGVSWQAAHPSHPARGSRGAPAQSLLCCKCPLPPLAAPCCSCRTLR